MGIKNYQDLIIWQKGIELVMLVYRVTKSFPKEELFGLTSQMRRAAVSIPANISEGWGRNTDKTFELFLSYSKGSLCELTTHFEIAKRLEFLSSDLYFQLKSKTEELSRMIYFFNSSIQKKKTKRSKLSPI